VPRCADDEHRRVAVYSYVEKLLTSRIGFFADIDRTTMTTCAMGNCWPAILVMAGRCSFFMPTVFTIHPDERAEHLPPRRDGQLESSWFGVVMTIVMRWELFTDVGLNISSFAKWRRNSAKRSSWGTMPFVAVDDGGCGLAVLLPEISTYLSQSWSMGPDGKRVTRQ